jgi:hypothetical protein
VKVTAKIELGSIQDLIICSILAVNVAVFQLQAQASINIGPVI